MGDRSDLRVSRRQLLGVAATVGLGACTRQGTARRGAAPADLPPAAATGASPPATLFVEDPPAPPSLLPGALLTGAAAHPREPWLATGSMTPRGEGEGQVIVWDLREGQPLHAYFGEHGFGFEAGPGLIAWAPSGRRLAAAEGTNAIAVLEDGKLLTLALPDETRDHPVDFCWTGDPSRLCAASFGPSETGAAAIIEVGSPDGSLRWTPSGVPPEQLRRMVYNPAISSVVGDDFYWLCGVDVGRGVLRYRVSLSAALPRPTIGTVPTAWSADGRRAAIVAPSGKRGHLITLFDGDDGKELGRVKVEDHVDALRWSPVADGGGVRQLAVVSGPHFKDQRQVHIIAEDRIVRTIAAPLARQALSLSDARTVDWSPRGDALALLLRDGNIRLVDVASGRTTRTIDTDPKLLATGYRHPGLLWGQGDCIIGLRESRITFWTVAGERVAHHALDAPPE